jgi:hypothetical protein
VVIKLVNALEKVRDPIREYAEGKLRRKPKFIVSLSSSSSEEENKKEIVPGPGSGAVPANDPDSEGEEKVDRRVLKESIALARPKEAVRRPKFKNEEDKKAYLAVVAVDPALDPALVDYDATSGEVGNTLERADEDKLKREHYDRKKRRTEEEVRKIEEYKREKRAEKLTQRKLQTQVKKPTVGKAPGYAKDITVTKVRKA